MSLEMVRFSGQLLPPQGSPVPKAGITRRHPDVRVVVIRREH
jgi:hypothetical protein